MQSNFPSPESSFGDGGLIFQAAQQQPKEKRKSSAGRKLMRWNPEKDQLVLLCIEHIVARDGIALDWNTVANEVEPSGSLSGEAIKQHLSKVRAARVEQGQTVPPKLEKGQIKQKKQLTALTTNKSIRTRGKVQIKKEDDDEQSRYDHPTPVTPRPRNNGLVYQKPQSIRKTSLKTEAPAMGAILSKKRKFVADEDSEGRPNTPNAVVKTVKSGNTVNDKLKVDTTPKKKRRTGLDSNFPDANPIPDHDDFGGGMNLRAQERVDYNEQVEETGVGGGFYSDASTLEVDNQDPDEKYYPLTAHQVQQIDAKAQELQYRSSPPSMAPKDLFNYHADNQDAGGWDRGNINTLTDSFHFENVQGYSTVPRSMYPEMHGTFPSYNGFLGGMAGDDNDGEMGVFQMDPFPVREGVGGLWGQELGDPEEMTVFEGVDQVGGLNFGGDIGGDFALFDGQELATHSYSFKEE